MACIFFLGFVFPVDFAFYFTGFQVWTVTLLRNSLVLYLAFFVSFFRSTCSKILEVLADVLALSFSWDLCFHLGNSKIFGWNPFYTFILDTFCFDFFVSAGGRKLFRNCIELCIAWTFPFWEPLPTLQYSLSGHCFWRWVSCRFLVRVNSEIFQL